MLAGINFFLSYTTLMGNLTANDYGIYFSIHLYFIYFYLFLRVMLFTANDFASR